MVLLSAPLSFHRIILRLTLLAALLIGGARANADILFEGFSKVLLDDVHVGYVIQRYEFDPKAKEFTTSYFLKTGPKGGNLTESLKARSTAGFRPVSYAYTSAQGDQTRTIDATFKGETMTAQVIEGTKRGTITKKVPKDVFLASFLGYVMLGGKEGIKKGVKYAYKAVAEEDLDIADGDAFVASEETRNNVSTFKVLNNFKKGKFVSWVTHKGEVIATASPLQKISTELVATIGEATAGQSVNTNLITMVFGAMPKGKENVIARRAGETVALAPDAKAANDDEADSKNADASATKQKVLETKPETTGNSKKDGIPGAKGIQIKGGAKSDRTQNPAGTEKKSGEGK